jgi:hypothetical protein
MAVMGGLMIAMLTGGFVQTQRKPLLFGAVGVASLVGILFLLERLVVTPNEEVAQTLHEIAADLQVNNIEGVVRHIASTSPELEQDARARLHGITLERVTIKRNLEIEVSSPGHPQSAHASFNCVVVGTDKAGFLGKRQGAFFFDVQLTKEQGGWRVASYEMKDPRAGMRHNR